MYAGDFEKAALYASAAVQRREELGVDPEDLLQGLPFPDSADEG